MVKKKSVSTKRPTVQDLVKLTGYSQGAISRAFNGQAGIRESTRDKIMKAAREIGYHPNPSARNFKRGYTGRVGIILPNLGNTNYSELFEKLDSANAEAGYASTLALTHDSARIEADTMLHWSAGETDALIVNPVATDENLELFRKLKSWRYPMVFLYKLFAGSEFDGVIVDYRLSLKQALIYLRDVGHKKVAYVGRSDLKKPVGKLSLMQELLTELGMQFDAELSVYNVAGSDAGPRAFSQWGVQKRRPTAVISYSDQTALSLFAEASCLGVNIPGDLSIFGSDDIAAAKAVGLSTIQVDRTEMARATVDVLRNRMEKFDSPVRIHKVTSELILRRSMGPARKTK